MCISYKWWGSLIDKAVRKTIFRMWMQSFSIIDLLVIMGLTHSLKPCPDTEWNWPTKFVRTCTGFAWRTDGLLADSPRVLAEFTRSACCFLIPVFGVTWVAIIWLQTRSHHPHNGESALDLSPFIICQMTRSTSQIDLASAANCCQLTDRTINTSVL